MPVGLNVSKYPGSSTLGTLNPIGIGSAKDIRDASEGLVTPVIIGSMAGNDMRDVATSRVEVTVTLEPTIFPVTKAQRIFQVEKTP